MAKKARKKAKPAKAAKAKRKPAKAKVVKKAKKKSPAKATKATKAKRVVAKAKAPAKKAKRAKARPKAKNVIGEGNYAASRNFDKSEAAFVKKNKKKIPAMGKAAEAALDGPDGAELMRAEAETAAHGQE
ncbi:MAG TPA: hypothetical protein VIJ85_02605 [Rhizomicrobium sp.]